jgi:L-fuculose-phosphate aldolase
MKTDYEIKEELCEIGRRIYQNGFVAANDGNFSVKVSEDEYFCTPTGLSKGFMTPEMILKVDGKGNMLESNEKYRPSSEFKMHLRVYRERPDVNAVVHAHPPIATAHAVAGLSLDSYIMPEAVIFLGNVPLTKYGTPSTMEIPDAISQEIQTHDAVLLQNHGALSMGPDLITAYFKMESLEFFAKVSYYANQLGGAQEFTDEQMEKLLALRKNMGLPGRHPGYCKNQDSANGVKIEPQKSVSQKLSSASTEDLIREITRKVLAELGKE